MILHNRVDKRLLKQKLEESQENRITLSFYQYAHIGNPQIFRDHLYIAWEKLGVLGRAYVAKEGINAQITVPEDQFDAFREQLDTITFLQGVRLNIAVEHDKKSFYKLKIKVKQKIVADGLNDESFDVTNKGKRLDAASFNQLTTLPDTMVVDMRNHYESEIGHFENAILPDADTFREALPMVENMLTPHKDKNIVMYCTGGIRCEKASAYLKHKGFNKVFQLDGGIIKYAHDIKEKGLENKFKGKNFVFDERLGERISDEVISHCHQCGKPCDTHTNCKNDACHLLFIQCDECAQKHNGCCSTECKDFIALPLDVQQEQKHKFLKKPTPIFKKGRSYHLKKKV